MMKLMVLLLAFLDLALESKAQKSFPTKCYPDLGCFSTGPPFYDPVSRPVSVLPDDVIDTQFLLYTSMNSNNPQVLKSTNESLRTSRLDPSLDTKFLIHGYLNELPADDDFFLLKDKLLKSCACNVVIVNWTSSDSAPYYQAVANSRVVAAQTAKFINFHVEKRGLNPKRVHLIGHSLGGQLAGSTGQRVPDLGRITGLDPAGPYFEHVDRVVRLDYTDADFVDVIHTNGAKNYSQGYGIKDPVGHMDFYPNGGSNQPGCFREARNQTDGEVNGNTYVLANSCSHGRSKKYYLSSFSRCLYVSTLCKSYRDFMNGKCPPLLSTTAIMGYHVTQLPVKPARSKFFLETIDEDPYCEPNKIEG